MIRSAGGLADALGDPAAETPDAEPLAACANAGAGVSAIWIGLGSEREYQSPTPASVATSTTTNPASSPRDKESRRSLIAMRARLGSWQRVHRDRGHVGSEAPQLSAVGDEVHQFRRADDFLQHLATRERAPRPLGVTGRRERVRLRDAGRDLQLVAQLPVDLDDHRDELLD